MISLDEMSQLVSALVDAERDVEAVEENLKRVKESARILREESIPSAMQELGLESVQLSTGQKVSVRQEVYASIPVANKEAAFNWLEEHGFGGLVKIEVVADFRKGGQEAAVALYQELQAKGLQVDLDKGVHAQTLKAFLKEQLAAGAELPLELFGARPVWTAKITNK